MEDLTSAFEEFAVDNAANLEADYAATKAKKSPPKAPKPPPAPKPASAAAIKEARKIFDRVEEDLRLEEKYKKLRVNNKFKTYFGGRLSGKYPKLTVKSDEAEIDQQNRDMQEELDGSGSVPATKEAFKMLMHGIESFTTKYCDVGLKTHGLGAVVSDPQVFAQNFDLPLTRLAIEHSLFEHGPLSTLLFNIGAIIITVHTANKAGGTFQKPAGDLAEDEEYADL